jgi:putative ABC transport system permease protein
MNLWQDIRYGERTLRKSPGFAATAVVTLALGIGVTTSVFSVCDSLLWKPVALPNLETLVMVLQRDPGDANDWDQASAADLDDVRRECTTIENLATWQGGMANIVGAGGEPDRAIQTLVSANFFTTFGVQPVLGRGFQEGEDQPGREREAVLSDRLWRRRFGADPGIVGKNIRLDDQNYLVTGVMPASFDFPMATELWTPHAFTPAQRANRRNNQLVAAARLRPGRTIEQAGGELASLGVRLEKSYPDSNKGKRLMVWPARRFMVDAYTHQYVLMLMCSVIFVLLIACANVANLQFARATGRLREVAVRTALGASRWRVITQLVTESMLLSAAGALCGLVIAWWGMGMTRAGMPPEIERYILGWKDIQMDGRTLLFTLVAAVASGILAGLAMLPAESHRRAEGRRTRRFDGRRAPSLAQHPGGERSGAGRDSAGRRGADGSRFSQAGGKRRAAGAGAHADHAPGDHRQQVPRTLPAHRVLSRRAGPRPRAARRAHRGGGDGAALRRSLQRARFHH